MDHAEAQTPNRLPNIKYYSSRQTSLPTFRNNKGNNSSLQKSIMLDIVVEVKTFMEVGRDQSPRGLTKNEAEEKHVARKAKTAKQTRNRKNDKNADIGVLAKQAQSRSGVFTSQSGGKNKPQESHKKKIMQTIHAILGLDFVQEGW